MHKTSAAIANNVAGKVQQLRQLSINATHAEWTAATNGTQENLEKLAQARAEYLKFWADGAAFEQFRAWDRENSAAGDTLLARQVHLLYYGYAGGQRDEATIAEMTQLMMQIDDTYTNFRAEVGGQLLTDNALEKILDEELDSEYRAEAWEATAGGSWQGGRPGGRCGRGPGGGRRT